MKAHEKKYLSSKEYDEWQEKDPVAAEILHEEYGVELEDMYCPRCGAPMITKGKPLRVRCGDGCPPLSRT